MKTIYKYILEPVGAQTLQIPSGAEFLSVQMQHGNLCLWAIVDPEKLLENEYFVIVGTGHPVPEKPKYLQYLGTVQQAARLKNLFPEHADGALVWHVFRAIK